MMGNFRQSQQAAQRAAAKARAQGARLIVAQARSDEGWAEERLGEFDKAAGQRSRNQGRYLRGRRSPEHCRRHQHMGDLLYDKGDNDEALRTPEPVAVDVPAKRIPEMRWPFLKRHRSHSA